MALQMATATSFMGCAFSMTNGALVFEEVTVGTGLRRLLLSFYTLSGVSFTGSEWPSKTVARITVRSIVNVTMAEAAAILV